MVEVYLKEYERMKAGSALKQQLVVHRNALQEVDRIEMHFDKQVR